ncbi:MAG TPA: DUF2062 domain-containing protein, partial [Gammaproteobacteria bacterium]|nr:DUF2062 domain-containing protein [Gammaproteobacteria bacterium]
MRNRCVGYRLAGRPRSPRGLLRSRRMFQVQSGSIARTTGSIQHCGMPRKFFKKILPSEHAVRNDKNLRFLGKLLHDPNLWHLNRKSLSGAFAVGLFMAFVPFPFGQTPAAALLAIFFRVNLPLSALLVWLTNPLTMPPIYLMAIKLGSWVLGIHPELTQFEMSWSWVSANLITFWKPFVVGSLIFSVVG